MDIADAPALDTAAGFTVAFWYLADANQGSIIAKPNALSEQQIQ